MNMDLRSFLGEARQLGPEYFVSISKPVDPVLETCVIQQKLAAEGRYDACISLSGKCDWDIAAAELILAEAGGVNTNSIGESFQYNRPDTRHRSVISAGPPMHAHILQFLETIDRPPGATW